MRQQISKHQSTQRIENRNPEMQQTPNDSGSLSRRKKGFIRPGGGAGGLKRLETRVDSSLLGEKKKLEGGEPGGKVRGERRKNLEG